MTKLTEYQQQINSMLDTLQGQLESNQHLQNPAQTVELLSALSVRWHFLSEEDRDYVQAAQTAVEEQLQWNL